MSEQGDMGLIFAADLGGTHLRAATVDHKGKIRFRFKQNTPQAKDASAIVDAIVAGEGNGPLAPSPVPLGLVTMGLMFAFVTGCDKV